MKLRVKGNSIRLRLTRSEVDRLASIDGFVEEGLEFGPGTRSFYYSIEKDPEGGSIAATYENDRLRVTVPGLVAEHWAASEDVGIEAEPFGMRILIEKDFACRGERSGEDESDMFIRPGAASECQ